MQSVLHRWQMTKEGLEDCGSSVETAFAPAAGSHRALSLRQARQAREVLGRFAPLGMRVLTVGLAASDMMRLAGSAGGLQMQMDAGEELEVDR